MDNAKQIQIQIRGTDPSELTRLADQVQALVVSGAIAVPSTP